MPAFTIVTTSATQDTDAAEVNTLTDDFGSETEALARLNAAEQATLRRESAKSKDPRGRTAGL